MVQSKRVATVNIVRPPATKVALEDIHGCSAASTGINPTKSMLLMGGSEVIDVVIL